MAHKYAGGLFYMLHGDITYVDEALYENKLSVAFDDLSAARETLRTVICYDTQTGSAKRPAAGDFARGIA